MMVINSKQSREVNKHRTQMLYTDDDFQISSSQPYNELEVTVETCYSIGKTKELFRSTFPHKGGPCMSFCIAAYKDSHFIIGSDSRISYSDGQYRDDYQKTYVFKNGKIGAYSHNLGTFLFRDKEYTFAEIVALFEDYYDCSTMSVGEINEKLALLLGKCSADVNAPIYFVLCGKETVLGEDVPVFYISSVENGIIDIQRKVAGEGCCVFGGTSEAIRLINRRPIPADQDAEAYIRMTVQQTIDHDSTKTIGGPIQIVKI